MEKKIKEALAYWGMVFKEVLHSVGGEMKPYLIAVIIALIISCGSTFGFLFGWLPTSWVDATWEQSAYSIISTVIFLGLLLIVALFVLVYTPARIHAEQERKYENFKDEMNAKVNQKEQEIQDLKTYLEEIESSKKNTRLLIGPKINEYGKRIDLEIRNKNSKNIMDCKAKLKKLSVFSPNGQAVDRFTGEGKPFYFRWIDEDAGSLDPVCEKSISSYEDEGFELSQINQMGWADANFSVELHSCEGDIQIVQSEEINASLSIIDVGISLELIFDFEDETRVYPYSLRICFDKKLTPTEKDGKLVYYHPLINFTYSEWENENKREENHSKQKSNP